MDALNALPAPRIRATDLFSLPVVSGAALDPTRRRIAFVRTLAEETANAYRGSVRVCELETGSIAVMTHGVARDSAPAWSPDGARLFFLSDRSGTMQLWCIDRAGGEAYAAPTIDGAVSEFAASPDGRFIAAVATSAQGQRDVETRGWRRVTRQRYRADGIGFHDELPKLWLADLERGSATALTDGSGFVAGPAWSPDSSQLAFVAEHDEHADGVAARELWLARIGASQPPRRLISLAASIQGPAWSPDGTRIAFIGSDDPTGGYGRTNLRLFSVAAAGGPPQCLTPSAEWTCGDLTITDLAGAGTATSPQWLPDGALAVLGTQRGATHVFIIEPDLRVRRLETSPSLSVTQFSVVDADTFACCATDSATPTELYVLAGGAARRLTYETQAWCERAHVRAAEHKAVAGPAGPIDAWHLAGDAASPRACILQIHGGPHSAYGDAFFFEFQLLAAAGYDVVYCNPRGSSGYGEKFLAAIAADWGDPALADCLAALDAFIGEGVIDERRLGVAGGSYGGYMVAWTIGHSTRFAAAVAMRAAINLESLWGTSEVGRMLDAELGGTPSQIPEVYRRNSPLTYADAVTTPVLLIHSERDYRCPIEQSEQFFTALRQRGREVELLRFTTTDHGLSRGGPPQQRVARLEAIIDWFDTHLARASKGSI